ncbi:MAG: hypothetical protein ABI836_06320 [Gemmatimonadota bacterium]
MRLLRALSIVLAIPFGAVHAQNEAALRRAFEGTSVVVRIDMPGTSSGVNVWPGQDMPVDFPDVAEKLKKYGTSLRMGDAVMVTKVKVKDDLIEFQLGGGGYGTFGDDTGNSSGGGTEVGETNAEKVLSDSIDHSTSSGQKRRMQRDLDEMRSRREQQNTRARADAAQAEEVRESNLRGRRVEGGARFNLRFRAGVPPEVLTPAGLRQALSRYVDFAGGAGGGVAAPATGGVAGVGTIRKGLTLEEVERLLGPALTASESDECALHVMKRTYRKDGQRTTAKFVSGVLVEYTISPE